MPRDVTHSHAVPCLRHATPCHITCHAVPRDALPPPRHATTCQGMSWRTATHLVVDPFRFFLWCRVLCVHMVGHTLGTPFVPAYLLACTPCTSLCCLPPCWNALYTAALPPCWHALHITLLSPSSLTSSAHCVATCRLAGTLCMQWHRICQ
eukprot:353404-Chlamydomonas_euryale.AAC.15